MPRQIQKIKQTQKIIQTHQEHTRAQTKKNQQTQKNHKRILYKQNQFIYIHAQTKLSRRKNRFKSEN